MRLSTAVRHEQAVRVRHELVVRRVAFRHN